MALNEDEILTHLLFLLAIDLEIEPSVYFHGDEKLEEWIEKIKEGQPIT